MTLKRLLHTVSHPVQSADDWWLRVSPRRRLDRNAGNMFMLIGLMLPTLSIVLRGPTPNSVLNGMPEYLQVWMCAFIFGGCGLKLYGALSGFKYFRPNVHLKDCYKWGFIGAPLASTGAIVYGYYILSNTENFWSALSGVSTPMFGIGISVQAFFYWLEWRRIERNEHLYIREAKEHREAQDEPDSVD